jgi:hypothetical protein
MDLTYWDVFCSIQPNLVLLMGDNVYSRSSSSSSSSTSSSTSSSSLQHEYNALTNHPSFRKAQQELCILATLDDNDYGTTQQEGIQLFQNTFQPTLIHPNAVYQSYQWTNQLQIILLDLRAASFRRHHHHDHQHHVLLDDDQWEWLERELHHQLDDNDNDDENVVQVRLIVSPLQVLSTGHSYECWNRYPNERQRFLQLVQNKKTSPKKSTTTINIILSGDRHVSALYYDPEYAIYEMTSSSLTHTIPNQTLDDIEYDQYRISSFIYHNNFGMLDIAYAADDNNNNHIASIHASIQCVKTGHTIQQWKLYE